MGSRFITYNQRLESPEGFEVENEVGLSGEGWGTPVHDEFEGANPPEVVQELVVGDQRSGHWCTRGL